MVGTTVYNALLERKGDRTVLVTTALAAAHRLQNRPRLFDRHIVLPVLYERVIEADERVGARGEVVQPLHGDTLRAELQAAYDTGVRACAIVFMHGYRFTAHEQAAAELARAVGFTQVSVSHEVSPLMKLVSRGDTTVVDAYLSPILRRYVDQVAAQMPGVRLFFMQSSGGLTEAHHFQGKDAILSGPAGGIVGMVRTAVAAGHSRVIGFDMGGTSTDVSHYAGEFERAFETQVAGAHAPLMTSHGRGQADPAVRWCAAARRPRERGRQPGSGELPPPAGHWRTDANVMLSASSRCTFEGVRAARQRAARRHRRGCESTMAGDVRRTARNVCQIIAAGFADCAEHGQRHQAIWWRGRRHAVHAAVLRRRSGQHAQWPMH